MQIFFQEGSTHECISDPLCASLLSGKLWQRRFSNPTPPVKGLEIYHSRKI